MPTILELWQYRQDQKSFHPMKTKLLVSLAILLPWSAHGAFFIEPRVSYVDIAGTPNIGDRGYVTSSDLPQTTVGIAAGCTITSRISVELRYTSIDGIRVNKAGSDIFGVPPGLHPTGLVFDYAYLQDSRIFAVALPLKLVDQGKITFSLVPLLQLERSDIELFQPRGSLAAWPIRHETANEFHVGAEVNIAYRLGSRTELTLNYTYSPLKAFDAHFVSAGLRVKI
jgi:hypothetical protein